jgi:hypothetical protein
MSAHAAAGAAAGLLSSSPPSPLPPLPPLALAAALGGAPADAAGRRRLLEQRRALQGPTPWSNWVIPGRLLAGGFPASPSDDDTRHTLLRLMGSPSTGGCGVTAFCCLQSELDPEAPASAWRGRGGGGGGGGGASALRPYPRDAAALLAEAAAGGGGGGKTFDLPALGPDAVVSCYGDGPPAAAEPPGGGGAPLDPFTATADAMGPGGSAAAAAAAANGRPPVPRDSPSASPRPSGPGGGGGGRRAPAMLLRPDRRVDFLHLPIPDGGTAPDAALSALASDVAARVRSGQVVYAHCWGGHGRTGSLVAVVLARLYGLPAEAALRATQACHDARVFPQGTRSPQTQAQRLQVARVVAAGAGGAGQGGPAGGGGGGPAAAGAGAGGWGSAGAGLHAPAPSYRPLRPLQPPSSPERERERERVGGGGGGGGGVVGGVLGTTTTTTTATTTTTQQRDAAAMPPPPPPVRARASPYNSGNGGDATLSDFDKAAGAVAVLLRKRSRSPNNKIPAEPAV